MEVETVNSGNISEPMEVCLDTEDAVRLYTTGHHYSRSVPLSLIEKIKDRIWIAPGGTSALTVCPTIDVLDQLLCFLTDSTVPAGAYRTSRGLLEVAFQYNLPELVQKVLDHILHIVIGDDPNLALKTYLEMGDMADVRSPELDSFMQKLHKIYPIYMKFSSLEEEGYLVEFRKAKGAFERIPYSFNIRRMDAYDYTEEDVLVDSTAFPLILKHLDGVLRLDQLTQVELKSIIKSCYVLGYRRLFCEAIRACEHVNELMAEDLFNLYLLSKVSHSEVVQAFDRPSWRTGEQVLIHIFVLKRGRFLKSSLDDLLVNLTFLPRQMLQEKLKTFLSRHSWYDLAKGFQSLDVVPFFRTFLEDEESINSLSNYKILMQLLELGAYLEYDNLYFKAYLALLRIEPGICTEKFPRLHNHRFTKDEVTSSIIGSRLVTLVAADQSRMKIHRDTLKGYSILFDLIISLENEKSLNFPCNECKNKDVLEAWVKFMMNGEIERSGYVFRQIEIGYILIELMHVADFYLIEKLMVTVLNELRFIVDDTNAATIYNALPASPLSLEVARLIKNIKQNIERRYLLELYTLPRFLNLDPFQFLTIISQDYHVETLPTVLEAYFHCNVDRLNQLEFVPAEWTESIKKMVHLPIIRDCLRSLSNRYSFFDEIVKGLANITDYADLSILRKSPNDLILFTSQHTEKIVYFHILKENGEIHKCMFVLQRLWPVSHLCACMLGRKLIIWNLAGEMSVINIDTRIEVELPVMGKDYSIAYWKGNLFAICKTAKCYNHLIFNHIEDVWDPISLLPETFPLVGAPLVVADRLYVLGNGEDWTRYIKPSPPKLAVDSDDDDDDHYDYVTDYVAPPPPSDEPISPSDIISAGNVIGIRVGHELRTENRINLIGYNEALVYDSNDLRFLERRPLPDESTVNVHDAIVKEERLICLCVARHGKNSPEVYELDCATWTRRVLFGSELFENVYLVYNRYGFLFNN